MKNLYVSDDGKMTSENLEEIKAYEAECAKADDAEVTLTKTELDEIVQKTADIVIESIKDVDGFAADIAKTECEAKCIVSDDDIDVAVSVTLLGEEDNDEQNPDAICELENSIMDIVNKFPFFKDSAMTVHLIGINGDDAE